MVYELVVGSIFIFLGILALYFPAKRYWRMAHTLLFNTKYTVQEYIEQEPNTGIIYGELDVQESITSPLTASRCGAYKIKEKTRNYHSSGANKKTTKNTYFDQGENYLYSDSRIPIKLGSNVEYRLAGTSSQKIRKGGKIPKGLQKLRNDRKEDIKEEDHTEMCNKEGMRTVEFVEKAVKPADKLNIVFSNTDQYQKITAEDVLLITDQKPTKTGIKLSLKAILLTGLGFFFTLMGYALIFW